MWRIGLDCRLSGLDHAGLGRYIHNLSIRLPTAAHQVNWIYFVVDDHQALPYRHLPNVTIKLIPIQHYTWTEQWQLPQIFQSANLDLLHIPHFNAPWRYQQKMVVTIHDLLWHQQRGGQVTTLPWWSYWPKYLGYRWLVSRVISQAERVIVPTQTVKDTVSFYYPSAASKTVVTYEGVDSALLHSNQRHSSSFIGKLSKLKTLIGQYWLYVGSLYPHKNLSLVLSALRQEKNQSLVVVCARDNFTERFLKQVSQLGMSDRVIWLGSLTDSELAQVYQQARVLIQPSLSEGFGLTGLEALAIGTPVIASHIAVFKEVYQQAALYFNPLSVTSFQQAVIRLSRLNRPHWQKITQRVLQRYDWGRTTRQTWDVYQQVLSPTIS